jgi:hypothetical protein
MALVLIVSAVVAALAIPLPIFGRTYGAIGDLVHAPLFGSLALAALWLWQHLAPLAGTETSPDNLQGRRLIARGWIVWFGLSLFGLAMERLQDHVGRSMSLHDAIANSLGAAAAVVGYTAVWFSTHRRFRFASLFAFLAVLIMAVAWFRPMVLLADVVRMPSQFPLLASFESPTEVTRWLFRRSDGRLVDRDVTNGDRAIEVTFHKTEYPAFTLVEMVPDWSGYDYLEFDATLDSRNPSLDVTMLIKIIDQAHYIDHTGAFRHRLPLRRGEAKRVRIPISETKPGSSVDPLDREHVVFVDLGLRNPSSEVTIRFDRMVLTN